MIRLHSWLHALTNFLAPSIVRAMLDVSLARQAFAEEIRGSPFVPDTAEVIVRDDAPPEAAVIHCDWPLENRDEYSGNRSREITVQIAANALNLFRNAQPAARGAMLQKFQHLLQVRLLDGQYEEQDPPAPAFIVAVDLHDLEG